MMDKVVADLADEAREFLGPEPVEVLPNGVDAEKFIPATPERKRAIRAELEWPVDATIYLYTGRFSIEKQLPWFLRAWQESAGENSLAVLVGDGPQRAEIEAISACTPRRVLILDSRDETANLYAAADVFFLPSTSEGLSNALLEAMSSGCAPLASRVGGTVETVKNEETGLLFGRDDRQGLKHAMSRLAGDSSLIARLGVNARKQVEERYSLSRVVDRLEELYRG